VEIYIAVTTGNKRNPFSIGREERRPFTFISQSHLSVVLPIDIHHPDMSFSFRSRQIAYSQSINNMFAIRRYMNVGNRFDSVKIVDCKRALFGKSERCRYQQNNKER